MEFRGDLGNGWGGGMERARDGKRNERTGRKEGMRRDGIHGGEFSSLDLGG